MTHFNWKFCIIAIHSDKVISTVPHLLLYQLCKGSIQCVTQDIRMYL